MGQRGGDLAGRACGHCQERYGDSVGNLTIVKLAESSAPAIGRLAADGTAGSLSDVLASANRGVWALDGACLSNLYLAGAVRDAVSGAPIRVSGNLVWPDLVVVVETDDLSTLPDWVYGAGIVWRDRPPASLEEERDLARVYDMRRANSSGRVHVGPLVHDLMARFGRLFRLGEDPEDQPGGWTRPSEMAGLCADAPLDEGCLTHLAAFRALGEALLTSGSEGLEPEMAELSAWLSGRVAFDVARVRAADSERSYERLAAERVARDFLLPLGILRAASDGGLPPADEQMDRIRQYEDRIATLTGEAHGKNGKAPSGGRLSSRVAVSVWDEIYDLYSAECDALALSGWQATEASAESDGPAKVDLESLRHDRHRGLGRLVDSEALATAEALAGELHTDVAPALSARLSARLVRDYSYCSTCAGEALDIVAVGSGGPYGKTVARASGLGGLFGAKRENYGWQSIADLH